jgi:hypothetical protein
VAIRRILLNNPSIGWELRVLMSPRSEIQVVHRAKSLEVNIRKVYPTITIGLSFIYGI